MALLMRRLGGIDESKVCCAGREDCMSLNPVESAGAAKKVSRLVHDPLRTADIDMASHGTGYTSRIARLNPPMPAPVSGGSPQPLIPREVNKQNDRNLRNDDIPWSKPHAVTFISSRQVDPVNPRYQLPSCEVLPDPEPPFRRETNKLDDIEGTKPLNAYAQRPVRNPLDYSDVAGTSKDSSFVERRRRVSNLDTLSVRDINEDRVPIGAHVNGIFKTRRVVDPLSPRYVYDIGEIGDMHGNHTKPQPKASSEPYFPLKTDDISGAKLKHAHKVPSHYPVEDQRRHFRNVNFIQDIEGSSPNKKQSEFAVQTLRSTNPLDPNYPLLDGTFMKGAPGSRGSRSGSVPASRGRVSDSGLIMSRSSRPGSSGFGSMNLQSRQHADLAADIAAVRSLQ